MSDISTPKRGRRASQVFDPSDWRKLFADQRQWVVLARVDTHDGEVEHFFADVDQLGQRSIFVDVVSIPGEIEMTCRLLGEGGIWRIPRIGALVYVALPDGIVDFVPAIVGVAGNPTDTSGLSETTAVIQLTPGTRLLIHDGDAGETKRVATIDDVQSVVTYVDQQFDAAKGHVHTVAGAVTTAILTGAGPFTSPTDGSGPDPCPAPAGTQTLEVK